MEIQIKKNDVDTLIDILSNDILLSTRESSPKDKDGTEKRKLTTSIINQLRKWKDKESN